MPFIDKYFPNLTENRYRKYIYTIFLLVVVFLVGYIVLQNQSVDEQSSNRSTDNSAQINIKVVDYSDREAYKPTLPPDSPVGNAGIPVEYVDFGNGFSVTYPGGWILRRKEGETLLGSLVLRDELKRVSGTFSSWTRDTLSRIEMHRHATDDVVANNVEHLRRYSETRWSTTGGEELMVAGRFAYGTRITLDNDTHYSVFTTDDTGTVYEFRFFERSGASLQPQDRQVLDSFYFLASADQQTRTYCPPDKYRTQKKFEEFLKKDIVFACSLTDEAQLLLFSPFNMETEAHTNYNLVVRYNDHSGVKDVSLGEYTIHEKGYTRFEYNMINSRMAHVWANEARDTHDGWFINFSTSVPFGYSIGDGYMDVTYSGRDYHLALQYETSGDYETGGTISITGLTLDNIQRKRISVAPTITVPPYTNDWSVYLPLIEVISSQRQDNTVAFEVGGLGRYVFDLNVVGPTFVEGDDAGLYIGHSLFRGYDWSKEYFRHCEYTPMVAYSFSNGDYRTQPFCAPDQAISADSRHTAVIQPFKQPKADIYLNGKLYPTTADYIDQLAFSPGGQTLSYRARENGYWYIGEAKKSSEDVKRWAYVYAIAYTADRILHAIVKDTIGGHTRWIELADGQIVNDWDYADDMLYLPEARGIVYRARETLKDDGERWFLVVNGKKQKEWDYLEDIEVDSYPPEIRYTARDDSGQWHEVTLPIEDALNEGGLTK
jgi:hypothetical protein